LQSTSCFTWSDIAENALSFAEKIDHFKKAQRISFFFVPLMRGLATTSLSYPLTLPAADAYFKTFLGSTRS